MPTVKTKVVYKYGGKVNPVGSILTVSDDLYAWLVTQEFADPVDGTPVPGTKSGAELTIPQRAYLPRRCCGW